jgi:hypothetical protein
MPTKIPTNDTAGICILLVFSTSSHKFFHKYGIEPVTLVIGYIDGFSLVPLAGNRLVS